MQSSLVKKTLEAALAMGSADIKLDADVTLSKDVTIPAGTKVSPGTIITVTFRYLDPDE